MKHDKNAPPVWRPFLDPQRVATVRLERARAKDPQRAAEMEKLTSLVEIYLVEINGSGQPVTMPTQAGA